MILQTRFYETEASTGCVGGEGILSLCPSAGDSQRGWVGLPGPAPVGKGQGAKQDGRDRHSAIPMEPRAPQALNRGESEFRVPGPHTTPGSPGKNGAGRGIQGLLFLYLQPWGVELKPSPM